MNEENIYVLMFFCRFLWSEQDVSGQGNCKGNRVQCSAWVIEITYAHKV